MNVLRLFLYVIRQGVPCLFHLLTGLYCPGCGGTRAAWYLIHGRLLKSLQYHPLVLYMALVLAAEVLIRQVALRKAPSPRPTWPGKTEGAEEATWPETAERLEEATWPETAERLEEATWPERAEGSEETKEAASYQSPPELPMKRYEREALIGLLIVLANWIFKNYMLVFRGIDLLSERPW